MRDRDREVGDWVVVVVVGEGGGDLRGWVMYHWQTDKRQTSTTSGSFQSVAAAAAVAVQAL